MNSDIDSSEAKIEGEGSFGCLASFVSAAGVAEAFDDPSKATSFNWHFTTVAHFQLRCEPLAKNLSLGLEEERRKKTVPLRQ